MPKKPFMKFAQADCCLSAVCASIEHGTWYARSAEFLQTPTMQFLRWMRVPGDVLFALGAAMLGWFVLGLLTGHSFEREPAFDREAEERELVAR